MHNRLLNLQISATAGLLYLCAYLLFRLTAFEADLATALSRVGPEEAQLAGRILFRADDFAPGPVGPGALATPDMLAWRVLIGLRDPIPVFRHLLRAPHRGAQLWALAGLKVHAPDVYELEAVRLRGSEEPIHYRVGCLGYRTTVGAVVGALDRGHLLVVLMRFDSPPGLVDSLDRSLVLPRRAHGRSSGVYH